MMLFCSIYCSSALRSQAQTTINNVYKVPMRKPIFTVTAKSGLRCWSSLLNTVLSTSALVILMVMSVQFHYMISTLMDRSAFGDGRGHGGGEEAFFEMRILEKNPGAHDHQHKEHSSTLARTRRKYSYRIISSSSNSLLLSVPDYATKQQSNNTTDINSYYKHSSEMDGIFSSSKLAVFVLSRRDAFHIRNTIRQTWASKYHSKKYFYFVVGKPCSVPLSLRNESSLTCSFNDKPLPENYLDIQREYVQHLEHQDKQLLLEQETYGDLILTNHVDSYGNLPLKLKACYEFVSRYLHDVKWVLKLDDDFYARLEMLENFLEEQDKANNKSSGPSFQTLNSSEPTVIGGIMRTQIAHVTGKWKEVPQWPERAIYPPFPVGSYGHIVSRPVVDYIARHKDFLFDYQGEDVSLGIWLNYSKIAVNFVHDAIHMKNSGNCTDSNAWVIGHQVTPQQMQICHELDDQTLKHDTGP